MSRYHPVSFTELPHWAADDHLAAFQTFLKSCLRLATQSPKGTAQALADLCSQAIASAPEVRTATAARAFFEAQFVPHRVIHDGPSTLLTAYYEPVLKGSYAPTPAFPVPILRRPADLVNLVDDAQRGAVGTAFTHMRKTAAGLVPFPTRAEIDAGALNGQGLELLYLADPVEVFFLQVQGSGQIEVPDGRRIRVAYDGKNGHPYTSIGRYLIDQGIIDANRMSLAALADWLRAEPARGRAVMQQNKSYVFFREMAGNATAPIGVQEIPLTAGRSLAVDTAHHAIGMPIYISSDTLTHATPKGGFHRLMIAQDVGSAIKGPERGDIYIGTGEAAGRIAGITKHPGTFYVLVPKAAAAMALKPTLDAANRPTGSLPEKGKAP